MKQIPIKYIPKVYLAVSISIAILIALSFNYLKKSFMQKQQYKNDCIRYSVSDMEDYEFANQFCGCLFDYFIDVYKHPDSFPQSSGFTQGDEIGYLDCMIESSDPELDSTGIEYYKYLQKVLKHDDCNYSQEKYRVIYRLKDDGISFTIGDVKISKGDTSRIASCTYSYQDKYYTSNKPIPDSVNVRNDTYFVLFSKFLPFINKVLYCIPVPDSLKNNHGSWGVLPIKLPND